MTFDACEHLMRKYAPLFMAGAEPEKPKRDYKPGPYRPPTPPDLIAQMKRMRMEGFTIGEIARATKVTWRTAWKHFKIT